MNNDTLTREPAIRDALAGRATSYDISLASLDEITDSANRRARRSRFGGGAVFALVALLFVGIGLGRGDSETSTFMFSGLQEDVASTTPAAIVSTNDGWIGATIVSTPNTLTPQSSTDQVLRTNFGEVHIATSTDGELWKLAAPTGIVASTPHLALDEHDGRYWLAVTADDEVQLAFSDDLSDWTSVELPPGASSFERDVAQGFVQQITPASLVANQAGIMLKIDSVQRPAIMELVEQDLSDTCDLRWAVDVIEWRECGTNEFQETEIPVDVATYPTAQAAPGGDSNLVFSSDGVTFAVFGSAQDDTRLPYSSGQRLYGTDTGFGLADYEVRESADAKSWTTFDPDALGRLSSPSFVAARGGERVASSLDPAADGLKHSIDGETWTTHSIVDLVHQPTDAAADGAGNEVVFNERGRSGPNYVITSLEAGDAGWAIGGWSMTGPNGYDTLARGETRSFEVPIGDLTITGTVPGGSAQLTNAEGDVVRTWDRFEPLAPWRTGVNRAGTDFIFVDNAGEQLASIAVAEWNERIENPMSPFIYAVLFSPDGMNWTKIHEGLDPLAGVSVGDDDVVIAAYRFGGLASERVAVDTAS